MNKLKRRDFCKQVGTSAFGVSVLPPFIFDKINFVEKTEVSDYRGNWYSPQCYVGFHFDIHVVKSDTNIGYRLDLKGLTKMLKLSGADFVQTDSKGHPGLTSWFSKTPGATVGPGVIKDWVLEWRKATKELGLPLHCHYSGLWEITAGINHPDWCIIGPDGKLVNSGGGFRGMKSPGGDKISPYSPYVDELMIPQLFELIDRYDVDGFWIDGDIWAVSPCYCNDCIAAFKEKTGISDPPRTHEDPHWEEWANFTKEGLEQYITRYCDAVHQHKPGILICSSYLNTFHFPGEPKVPTDWISADFNSRDRARCEARFISTRGKPWDLMIWANYRNRKSQGEGFEEDDWVMKPALMLQQQAAMVIPFGGNVQVNDYPFGLRDGRLVPWRINRLREVFNFVKSRRTLCQNTVTIPQIAVLHSEHHLYSQPGVLLESPSPSGANLSNFDLASVQGAVHSLLECHYGVDILDEWALLPRLSKFPVVVIPEQERMSQKMVDALKEYVQTGGKLLVSGVAVFDRFGDKFFGIKGSLVKAGDYYLPADNGVLPVFTTWRLVETREAEEIGKLGANCVPDLLPNPAATIHHINKGAVGYIPFDIFRFFNQTRYVPLRVFIQNVLDSLAGKMEIQIDAPTCVDVVLRQKEEKKIIHMINRASGTDTVVDEIPQVGPITIVMNLSCRPKNVYLAFEEGNIQWNYDGTQLRIGIASVHIHAAVVIEGT